MVTINNINRLQAWELLNEYTQTEYLIKHALAVESVMRHFAELLGEPDVERWGIIGLLHDLDYDRYPNEHCIKVQEILAERNISPDIIRSIASHCYDITVDIKPEHVMEKVLYASDELTGLIHAATIMRPSKNIMELEVKSVLKKYKVQNFAAGVSRSVIEKGLGMLEWKRTIKEFVML